MANTSSRWWLRHDSEHGIVAASPERIYELVADMPRMGEWSPECQRVEWTDGAVAPAAGAPRAKDDPRGGVLPLWPRDP